MEQCLSESSRLEAVNIDPQDFCTCVTADIGDGASMSEANEAITARTQQCTNEAVQEAMGAT